jgi:hypothetical protein
VAAARTPPTWAAARLPACPGVRRTRTGPAPAART